MALTFTINGVNRRANLRDGTLSIDKHLGLEVLTAQVLEKTTPGASAFRPTLGHAVYVTDGANLLFGGEIIERREETVWQAGGLPTLTLNTITAKSYDALAERIVIDTLTVPSQGVFTTAASLCTTYLTPLGVTNIGTVSGGPVLPALEFDHQTLSAIFGQLTLLSGYPWRINGDKQFAFVAPGSFTGTTITEANALEADLRIEQTRAVRVNRLFLQTGGTGTVTHTEGRTLNGTQTTFLLNVEPAEPPTTVTENGVSMAIGGGTWTYNSTLKAVVRASGGTNGHLIVVPFTVTFPAWVRVWDASVQAASGAWTTTALVDGLVEASEQTDLGQAKAWGDEELSRRFLEPLIVTVRTRTKNYYPLLHVTLTLPDSNISGTYLVESVRVEAQDDDNIVYAAVCVQDDVLHTAWFDYFKRRGGTTGGGMSVAGTGSTSGTPGTPGGGGTTLPSGTTFHLGGSNDQSITATTSWQAAPEAIPTQLGGTGMAGTWTLRVPMYQLSAGTMEVRLYDQTAGAALATLSSTAVGTYVDVSFYSYQTGSVTAPAGVSNVLLEVRVTSGSRPVVVGHSTVVKA